jgi:hypothetical protein
MIIMELILEQGVLMKKLVVLGIVGILAGCAAPMWHHATNNEYDFNRDRSACSMEAERSNPSTAVPFDPRLTQMQQAQAGSYNAGANLGRAFGVKSYFENCMLSKGYYQVKR